MLQSGVKKVSIDGVSLACIYQLLYWHIISLFLNQIETKQKKERQTDRQDKTKMLAITLAA